MYITFHRKVELAVMHGCLSVKEQSGSITEHDLKSPSSHLIMCTYLGVHANFLPCPLQPADGHGLCTSTEQNLRLSLVHT